MTKDKHKPILAIRLDAGLDKNGNGRRGWLLVSKEGHVLDFVKDYGSRRIEHNGKVLTLPTTGTLRVTPGELNAWSRLQNDREDRRNKGTWLAGDILQSAGAA